MFSIVLFSMPSPEKENVAIRSICLHIQKNGAFPCVSYGTIHL